MIQKYSQLRLKEKAEEIAFDGASVNNENLSATGSLLCDKIFAISQKLKE